LVARLGSQDGKLINKEVLPDRNQCPPDEKVRDLAAGKLQDEAVKQHVEHCEACNREFHDHARDLEWNRFLSRSTYGSYVVIAVLIAMAVFRSCHY
jgi:hypothetical protein